jgi:transcriptional regulator
VYRPPAFREDRREVLHELIRRHSFGTLVSMLDGEPFATPLPFLLDSARGEHGTLMGHMARANPHWRGFAGGADALVLFQGPHAYISPSWYATRVAVPTWNYVAVHASGRPRLLEDEEMVRTLLAHTVREFESPLAQPWDIDQLDREVVTRMMGAIVAFEIPISRLEGKRKLNQNRSDTDRQGVVDALRRQGDPLGVDVADLMAADLDQARPGAGE